MSFELKIESLADFKEFVRIIRNKDIDDYLLTKETKQLDKATDKLSEAISKNT